MTKEDDPEYYEHVCNVILSVFAAENNCVQKQNIKAKLNAGEITPQEYVEMVADELISRTDYADIAEDEARESLF